MLSRPLQHEPIQQQLAIKAQPKPHRQHLILECSDWDLEVDAASAVPELMCTEEAAKDGSTAMPPNTHGLLPSD